jgi:hypothetical protein
MKNLQTLHIFNPLSSFSLLSLLSFFSKSFFLFPALILLFVVPRQLVNEVTLDLGSKHLGKLFLGKSFMFNYVFEVKHRNS